MARLKKSQFTFRKHDRIGAEGAEEDQDFLFDCFVDTGELEALRETESAYRVVVGRTGIGKTALLLLLRKLEENVAWLEPEKLALQYLSNSTILPRLEEIGVDLDVFYRLLWRHIFAVELIRLKYKLRTESDQQNFLERLYEKFFGDKKKKAAFEYLISWGEHFWEDTEYRVHEVTQKLERDIKGSLGAKASILEAGIAAGAKYTTEEKKEVAHRVQEVVNSVQIRQLAEVIDSLAEDVFDDPQERFYVVIDRLDEKWVEDGLRYRLIRALIETVRDLRRIGSTKLILALRKDLLDRVFRETRDSGFQEEKYQPLILHLHWTPQQLLDVLNRRVNRLVCRRYTKGEVSWHDIFPPNIGKQDTETYLLERTMFRPRDIIEFANCCIAQAVDRPEISVDMIRAAEAEYSNLRFRSLGDEWVKDYPELLTFASILLRRKPTVMRLTELPLPEIEELILQLQTAAKGPSGSTSMIQEWSKSVMDGSIGGEEFRRRLVAVFYRVGMVGVRPTPGSKVSWSFLDMNILREAEITDEARVEICPMLLRVLGTDVKS